jgi:hypothetical protein
VQQKATLIRPMHLPPRGYIWTMTRLTPLHTDCFMSMCKQLSLYRHCTVSNYIQSISSSSGWQYAAHQQLVLRIVLMGNGVCLNNFPKTLSSQWNITRGLSDSGQSLASFVSLTFPNNTTNSSMVMTDLTGNLS